MIGIFQKKPVKGEEWFFKPEGPWAPKKGSGVEILDVEGGWVRYRIGEVFPDERMKVWIFKSMYRSFGAGQ